MAIIFGIVALPHRCIDIDDLSSKTTIKPRLRVVNFLVVTVVNFLIDTTIKDESKRLSILSKIILPVTEHSTELTAGTKIA